MKLVFLMSSLVGAFGADCEKGYVHRTDAQITSGQADAGGLLGWCSNKEAASKSTCQTGCCVADPNKCGSYTTCPTGKYNGVDGDTATTATTYQTTCCVAVATCATSYGASLTGAASCAANPGWKYKTSSAATLCSGGTTSCKYIAAASCCEKDVLKCGGLTVACASPKTSGNTRRRSTAAQIAWGNKATTEANKLTDCCTTTAATCANADATGVNGCNVGYEKDTTKATELCAGQTGTGGYYRLDKCYSTCCKLDVTKCGGLGATGCTATQYTFNPTNSAASIAWAGKTSAAATKATDCCTTKAKCAAGTCPAGYKMKASVTTTDCTSDAASCGVGTTCCEKDVLKCGGLASIVCAAGTYNACAGSCSGCSVAATKTAWDACLNKAATEATKNTACCTAKGKCSAFKAAVSASALVSKTAAQMLPGAFLLVVLSAIGAVW